jgi:2-polyprenyl-6-methoxyphenol hydroxylase-like FAD-dependent oxidoreductase
MLGIMPTGRETGSGVPMVSLFWSLRADRFDHWREAGLDRFRQALLALHPGCEDLLAQLRSVDDLTWARYRDVAMPRYHEGNCVVIGDAAHATSPQLGQGTNLALLDAIALRQCLRQGLPVSRALAHYSDLRRGHTRFYGQASRWLTPLFQSDLPVLPWLRDLFMAPSARWPWVGRLTFETLVGVRRGWLGARALDLEAVEKG